MPGRESVVYGLCLSEDETRLANPELVLYLQDDGASHDRWGMASLLDTSVNWSAVLFDAVLSEEMVGFVQPDGLWMRASGDDTVCPNLDIRAAAKDK